MEAKAQPIVSTYVHVPTGARISHALDSSNFGVSASIRIGEHGQNDATLFFRTPEQLEKLAEEATRSARGMRQAIALRAELERGSLLDRLSAPKPVGE